VVGRCGVVRKVKAAKRWVEKDSAVGAKKGSGVQGQEEGRCVLGVGRCVGYSSLPCLSQRERREEVSAG